jgi:hypothetical protein
VATWFFELALVLARLNPVASFTVKHESRHHVTGCDASPSRLRRRRFLIDNAAVDAIQPPGGFNLRVVEQLNIFVEAAN